MNCGTRLPDLGAHLLRSEAAEALIEALVVLVVEEVLARVFQLVQAVVQAVVVLARGGKAEHQRLEDI